MAKEVEVAVDYSFLPTLKHQLPDASAGTCAPPNGLSHDPTCSGPRGYLVLQLLHTLQQQVIRLVERFQQVLVSVRMCLSPGGLSPDNASFRVVRSPSSLLLLDEGADLG